MTDMKKTLKGLEIHGDRSDKTDCDDCPYSKDGFYKGDCIGQLCRDALALLKEQKETRTHHDIRLMLRDHVIGFCPECKEICIKAVNPRFCGSCGQAVKWND
jgi:hypothetical protein